MFFVEILYVCFIKFLTRIRYSDGELQYNFVKLVSFYVTCQFVKQEINSAQLNNFFYLILYAELIIVVVKLYSARLNYVSLLM